MELRRNLDQANRRKNISTRQCRMRQPTGRQQFVIAPLLMGIVGFLLIEWGRHGELRVDSQEGGVCES